MKENEEIWNLLILASTQWRTGGMDGTPYGLDYNVIIEIAKALGIGRDQIFFEKVKAFESEVLMIWKEKKKKGTTETDEEYLASIEALKNKSKEASGDGSEG